MLGRSVGLTSEEVSALAEPDSCDSFDATDRLVLRYADVLTRENRVEDKLFDELARTFSQRELIELCMATAMAGMVNRVHATFQTDVDTFTKAVTDEPSQPASDH